MGTWKPGDDFWLPHNRGTPRRITDVEPEFSGVKVDSGGYGILDCDYRTPQEAWAVGGGGTMYRSTDGGKTFKFDASADRIPGNLYTVKFFDDKTGFALGS